MLHVSDIHTFKGKAPDRFERQDRHVGGSAVRGLCQNGRGCRCGRVCPVAAYQRAWPYFVDSGQVVASGNRAAAFAGAWRRAIISAAGGRAACRCADRSRRRLTLQGAYHRGRRDLGRFTGVKFHRNETAGAAGRGLRRALLVDPTWRNRRSQRRAGSLADHFAAFGAQPRRYKGTRRSALAVGTVSFSRQATRHMGSTL